MTIPKPGIPFYQCDVTQFNDMWDTLGNAFVFAETGAQHAQLCYALERMHKTARFAWPCHEFGPRKSV